MGGGEQAGGDALTAPVLLIRVRSAEDAAAQHLMHRHNSLARALNDSTCLSPETAAQRVPYATARVSGLGGDVQVKLMAVRELIPKLEQERRQLGLPWEDLERIDALLQKSYEALDKLSKQLAELDTGRGYRGRPDLYRVSVPGLSYGGGMEGEQAAEEWTLNTHDLPEDVRAWLTGYLLSGAQAMPYRLRNGRYNPQSNVSADMRSNLRVIWSHLLPETPWLASEPAKSA